VGLVEQLDRERVFAEHFEDIAVWEPYEDGFFFLRASDEDLAGDRGFKGPFAFQAAFKSEQSEFVLVGYEEVLVGHTEEVDWVGVFYFVLQFVALVSDRAKVNI